MENKLKHKKQMYAYWLNSLPGIGGKTIDKLLKIYGSPEEFYHQMKESSKQTAVSQRPSLLSEKQLEMMTAMKSTMGCCR